MTPDTLQSIHDYIEETYEALSEWNMDSIAMEAELSELHRVIKYLMDKTFEEKVLERRVLLATLEYKARKCRECCLRRLGIRN